MIDEKWDGIAAPDHEGRRNLFSFSFACSGLLSYVFVSCKWSFMIMILVHDMVPLLWISRGEENFFSSALSRIFYM